ncbi:MAG: deoxyribodipyrimidine photolyase [Betaproteobacteria bacterium HGW-Betaproteobacteria-13]|jgi:diguanylate cyclase (GGDEF)-like protein|nr:MAG: deoxyribodipyrimidine photolyase [Betaproteobacteria bacterium HGW-Betaproteobacteria-13]
MPTERQRLIQSLFEDYIEMYASRDARLITCFSENFSGYAGSSDVLVTDRAEWIRITALDFAQVPERLHIEMLDLALQDLADDVVAVTAFFHIHLPFPESILARETARLVLIFRLEGDAWKIAHSGISIPFGLAGDDEIYPMVNLRERNRELEALIETRTHALAEANRKLEALSNTDGLTGVANRRSFDQALSREWDRGQRSGAPLSLVMLDVDLFKHFNDTNGHLAGDACLQALARLLAQSARRAGDLVARFGGEEFVVLLPETGGDDAMKFASHLLDEIRSLALPHAGVPASIVTASIGVASLTPSRHNPPEYLVEHADRALYRAKQAGRNCMYFADESLTD